MGRPVQILHLPGCLLPVLFVHQWHEGAPKQLVFRFSKQFAIGWADELETAVCTYFNHQVGLILDQQAVFFLTFPQSLVCLMLLSDVLHRAYGAHGPAGFVVEGLTSFVDLLDPAIIEQQAVIDVVGDAAGHRFCVGVIHEVAVIRVDGVQEGLVGGIEALGVGFKDAEYFVRPPQLFLHQVQLPTADMGAALRLG